MKTEGIDFSALSLRSLRKMLPSTDGVETPAEPWLRENPDKVLCSGNCGDGTVTVYSNGFYTYTEDSGEHLAVLRVDGFHRIRYDFADKSKQIVEEDEYLDCSYLIGLYINGQNQWLRNTDRRTCYYHGLYLDYDEGDWAEGVAALSAEDEMLEKENRRTLKALLGDASNGLTKRQRDMIRMYFYDGLTQNQIAKVTGLSRTTVRDHLSCAIKKMKTFFIEDTAKDPQVFRAY